MVGVVRDETNAIALPGVPVEVVGTTESRFRPAIPTSTGATSFRFRQARKQIKVALEGYQEGRIITVEAAGHCPITLDVGLTMARFADAVEVKAELVNVETSSA